MSVLEALRMALQGLFAQRLRAALTMLGILIGVSAVIVLVAVGNGNAQQINNQIQSLGSNLLTVFSTPRRGAGGVAQQFGSGTSLTLGDARALADRAANPDLEAVVPSVNTRAQVTWTTQNTNTSITGTSEEFPTVRNYAMAEGDFLTAADVSNDAHVAVVGATVVDNLFNGADPLGQAIKINRQPFVVIGVLASKGSAGFQNQDDTIIVPVSTAQAYLTGSKTVNNIFVEAASPDVMSDAQAEIQDTLLTAHHIQNAALADFQVLNQSDILQTASSITASETLLLGAIAAISLVVGGIGIMNIMLVTVTERTREIGIRKAIGARRRDIIVQFLIESVMLGGVGGAVGVLTGIGVSLLLPHLSSLTTVVSASSIALALSVSVAIGLFFGLYPANRAAGMHPIQALHYE